MNIKGALSAFFTVLFSLTTLSTYAQAVPHARISTVVQKSQTIEFTIESSEAFYVGGNVFLLQIGQTIFHKYNQTDVDGKGKLTYLIPMVDFAKLSDGEAMYITYGELFAPNASTQEMQTICIDNPNTAKYLGVFNSKLLKK
jgi:hypothetical protein